MFGKLNQGETIWLSLENGFSINRYLGNIQLNYAKNSLFNFCTYRLKKYINYITKKHLNITKDFNLSFLLTASFWKFSTQMKSKTQEELMAKIVEIPT